MSEKQLPIVMACRLSVRYELNQLRAVPDIPYHDDKRVMRMSWSMVSKAADRSSRVSAVTLPLRTGYTCAHLKSSGNKLEHSDAFIMSVIGLIKTSRHAFSSTVGSLSRSQDFLGDDMVILFTSAVVAVLITKGLCNYIKSSNEKIVQIDAK